MLHLYTIFHLNLAYSSIPEERFADVITKCYWPMLRLATEDCLPIGIEASALTLETIDSIDSSWIETLREAIQAGNCEFVGSGYSQIIGPLVPATVNDWNQKIGIEVYQRLLNVRPQIALVNEMAYSSGMIEHYLRNGYEALVMEWNNPYRHHEDWDKRWRHYPQNICDQWGNSIPVIWNDAILFQKFQRYAHGESTIEEYLNYLESVVDNTPRFIPFYGNDVEIFDFRPGRFHTEAALNEEGEWVRIRTLIRQIKSNPQFGFILPSKSLNGLSGEFAGNSISLESTRNPIPVKKQEKYNITRWAVTGVADGRINTQCYKMYSCLMKLQDISSDLVLRGRWKKLCYLWSSDFRTHIEEERWKKFLAEMDLQLEYVMKQVGVADNKRLSVNVSSETKTGICVRRKGANLTVETGEICVVLDCRKGLTLKSAVFKNIDTRSLIGTIPHGHYDDISYGADFFTGHTIIERSGSHKITDLMLVEPVIEYVCTDDGESVRVSCTIQTEAGLIKKEITIAEKLPSVLISYDFDLVLKPRISFRTGVVTFIPESFDGHRLFFRTVNGGHSPEIFQIEGHDVEHSQPVNTVISAKHCLGATDSWMDIGDADKYLRISTDKSLLYNVPMIDYRRTCDSYFLRCYHSLQETDETSGGERILQGRVPFSITAFRS